MTETEKYLNFYFGHSHFRGDQKEIIETIISGRDTLIIMPSGGGKSLCYQLPALILPGLALVISPLIALMKDQVDKLHRYGIKADFINSSLQKEEIQEKFEKIKRNEIKILYIAPERIQSRFFLDILRKIKVSLIAVDEAHCISQWGYNFRPDYMKLKELIYFSKKPPVIALTATATLEVRKDIINKLGLKKPLIKISGFDRENFIYEIKKVKSNREKDEILWDFLCEDPGCGIIYTGTRKGTEILAEKLKSWGIKAEHYHGGMDKHKREDIQNKFMQNHMDLIVSTSAFGMGVDKPDIPFIIHYTLPGSLEEYYQETGRAGRDNKGARAILLFRPADIDLRKNLIKKKNLSKNKERELEKLYNLMEYIKSPDCRKKFILSYFGEYRKNYLCNSCDNCSRYV